MIHNHCLEALCCNALVAGLVFIAPMYLPLVTSLFYNGTVTIVRFDQVIHVHPHPQL